MFTKRQVAVALIAIMAFPGFYAAAQNTFPASGNVGIGTTSPAYALDVNGLARIGFASVNPIPYATLTVGMNPSGFTVLNLTNSVGSGAGAESIYLGNTGTYTAPNGATTAGTQYFIISGGPDVSGGGGTAVHENTLSLGNSTNGINSLVIAPNGNVGLGHSITSSSLTGAGLVILGSNGSVGIGTTSPGAALEVNGNVKLSAGSGASVTFADGTVQSTAWTGALCGGDYAESIQVADARSRYEPGDVLVVDSRSPGKFLKSAASYSTLVAGVFSTKPGLVGRRQTTPKDTDEIPMAMIGIVPTKVSAENGVVRPGDLLVTSTKPGYAMKGTDRARLTGAILGKALGSVETGAGVIEVLVTLQ